MPTYYIDPVNGNDTNDGLGWWRLAYTAGHTAAPILGTTVTGAGGATGVILSTTLSSGTWAGNNAAGYFYMYGRNATAFANGENITWTGGSATNNQGTPYDSIYSSFKTIKKTFAAGDTINIAKSIETAGAGTVTATTGSVSVATTNDLSGVCPQYTVIRIGGDNTLYMVQAITSSVITLYRPYRGTTGSGKGLVYFGSLPTSANGDGQPSALVGTAASPITVTAGVNPASNSQDGYTIFYGNNADHYYAGTWTFVNGSRLATLYWTNVFTAAFTDCLFSDIYTFRNTFASGNLNCYWTRVTVNKLVSELGYLLRGWGSPSRDITINNFETAETGHPGFTPNFTIVNMIINGFKNIGYSGQAAIAIGANSLSNVIINDAVLDELNSGCDNFLLTSITGTSGVVVGLVNPTLGHGVLFDFSFANFTGSITLSHINGTGAMQSLTTYPTTWNHYTLLSRDDEVYHTAAPSARINIVTNAYTLTQKHTIPFDAGVTKTISVWMMKNSNPISTFTINAAGSGYVVGDTFAAVQAGAGASLFRVASLSGSGVATATLLSPGYNFSVANGLTTTTVTGAGSGCKINVTAVGTGYGSLTLPIMRLRWLTGTAPNLVSNVHDEVMPDTNNAWQQLSYQITPSVQGLVSVELIFQSANTGAMAWYDDFGVA